MIFTLDGRGNILLPLLFDTFQLGDENCAEIVQGMFEDLKKKLLCKGIEYSKLKSALIPVHKEKRETAFLFDTDVIKDAWYGNTIFRRLLPAFNKESTFSILAGDLIAETIPLRLCREIIFENLVQFHPTVFQHPTQYHVVYINNLSDDQHNKIVEALRHEKCFVGYVDMTFSGRLKTILANCLVPIGIKHRGTMILSHEDDREDSEDVNNCGYAFEDYGFSVKSISNMYFTLFLSYKMESIFADPKDLDYSINAINPFRASEPVFRLPVFVSEDKIQYLKENKSAIMEKLGLQDCSVEILSELIKDHIRKGYFYNLEYLETYRTPKFNLSLELKTTEGKLRKVLVALKYSFDNERLELITMY